MYTELEIADMFQVTQQTVLHWIRDHKLKAFKVGGTVRITEEDLKEFIERNKKK